MQTVEIINSDLLGETIMRKGYTQGKLSDKIKYSQSIISAILVGKRNPSYTLANSICKELNLKFDKFFLIKTNYKSN